MRKRVSVLVVLLAGLLMTLAPAAFATGPKKDKGTQVQLLEMNDFRGNLQPPSGSSGRISTGPMATVDAGGVEYLATWIKNLRERNSNTITVGAGDRHHAGRDSSRRIGAGRCHRRRAIRLDSSSGLRRRGGCVHEPRRHPRGLHLQQ